MSNLLLTDADVASLLTMPDAIACMEDAFRQQSAGTMIAPARFASDLGPGQLVFTAGASTAEKPFVGFRVYDLLQLQSPKRGELTAVFSAEDGSLKGMVAGPLLGAVRTGAIGGVAIKYLAHSGTRKLGVLGTGYQARTQLEAALAVREFESIAVFSRTADRCKQFAVTMSEKYGREIRAVETPREAVEESDVLICATTSREPVVESAWLPPGVHINNVGPKFKDGHELGLDVAETVDRRVTDSPAQLEAFSERFLLQGTPWERSVNDLAEIVAGKDSGRRSDQERTLFYSLGLAGTEVLLANLLLERVSADR